MGLVSNLLLTTGKLIPNLLLINLLGDKLMSTEDIVVVIESTIKELIEQGESLRDKAETTISHAFDINERVINRSERSVPLDDQPYGEELIRTGGMVESIEKQLTKLEQVRDEEDLSKAVKIIQSVEEVINKHTETFDDCFSDSFVKEAKKGIGDYWNDMENDNDWDEDEEDN